MSQFHKPRFSNAIVFALLCINSSLASPIAERSQVSIVSASEPVRIVPSEDLPPERPFSNGRETTSNDGDSTTGTTTFDNRDLVQRGDALSIVSISESAAVISSVSEPVNIISSEDFPQGRPIPDDRSTTYDDGTTRTTTFHDRRNVVPESSSDNIVSASEPVYVEPPEPGQNFSSGSSSNSSSSTNDGTTVTTTYSNPPRVLLQTQSNATGDVNLMNAKNETLIASELDMGLNCEGSRIMCFGANQVGVMHTLRDYMYAIPTGYRYYAGQDIACMKHNVYPNPWITWGFYCSFMQGNIPAEGVDGAVILLKMQQMIEHHCLGCGSVPFSPDNDPNTSGILTVNYVRQSECEGLCYYKPPGIAANAAVKVPKGMTLVS